MVKSKEPFWQAKGSVDLSIITALLTEKEI